MDKNLNLPHYEDLRDKNFTLEKYLESIEKKNLQYKTWKTGEVEDQGAFSTCVGYAAKMIVESEPHPKRSVDAEEIFALARKIENAPKKKGTSIRAGLQAIKDLGYIKNYYWADKIDEIIIGLLNVGPVLVGITWYHGMQHYASGFLPAAGGEAGEHALVLNGVNLDKGYFTGVNSFGTEWGIQGKFKISRKTLEKIFKYGAACVKV